MSELKKYQTHVESQTEQWLRPYLNRLSAGTMPTEPKVFNDAIWGSIVLYPFEIVLLDSPLIQRLRHIRQLGVAHWVYPSAMHSRLEHTLGVVHLMQRLIDSINTPQKEFINQKLLNMMRLAALCHDIGHGLMSHVSENALHSLDPVVRMKLDFADQHADIGKEVVKLSEIASYYMIGSPAFKELLEVTQDAIRDYLLPEDAAGMIQKAVVGSHVSDEIPLLHELIFGPFDADKLDYMRRDAQMCGVPVVTDIPRLIQKIRAIEVARDQLPQDVAKTVRGGLPAYTMIGMELSGGRTLDELLLGRSLLFDKIYRHHKVRAAEAMVASILLQIKDIVAEMPALIPLVLSDDQLLEIDETSISQLAGRSLSTDEKVRVSVAVDLAGRLKVRRLLVRCFAFAQKMPLDPYEADIGQRVGLQAIQGEAEDANGREQLTKQIVDEVKAILNALHQEDILDGLQKLDLKPYIWLSPPEPPTQASDVPRAYLIGPGRNILRFRDESAETRGWADAYLLARDVGYVFAPAEIAPFCYLATEKVVRRFGVRIPQSMVLFAKQSANTLDPMRKRLADAGYYASDHHDLRPLPERLRAADVPTSLRSIMTRLASYCGPVPIGESPDKGVLCANRIRDWLHQFETDDLVDAALRVLQKVRLVGRKEAVDALDAFLKAHHEFEEGFLCPLGQAKDSGAIVAYYAGDISATYKLKVESLADALAFQAPIVLVDDFIHEGNQAVTILESWLGLEPSVDLKEERYNSLSEELQCALKKRPLAFVFTAGRKSGADHLQKRMQELGITAEIEVHISDQDLPRAFESDTFVNVNQESDFRNRCEQIGQALLLDPDRGHDEEWVKHRLLGYGNQAYLVVFPYNTPTQTLTCLWATGQFSGLPWNPLFPRRPKE